MKCWRQDCCNEADYIGTAKWEYIYFDLGVCEQHKMDLNGFQMAKAEGREPVFDEDKPKTKPKQLEDALL
mgnify:CR=1 FL=1